MTTVVRKWGNSIGIRLPKTLAQEVDVSEGASVTIEARDGRIIITPVHSHRYQLADLVRHITPQAGHEQAGRRPGLVLSPRSYNAAAGLALFCPITSRVKGYPFEVSLPPAHRVQGGC